LGGVPAFGVGVFFFWVLSFFFFFFFFFFLLRTPLFFIFSKQCCSHEKQTHKKYKKTKNETEIWRLSVAAIRFQRWHYIQAAPCCWDVDPDCFAARQVARNPRRDVCGAPGGLCGVPAHDGRAARHPGGHRHARYVTILFIYYFFKN
jgi:hypothetical protein